MELSSSVADRYILGVDRMDCKGGENFRFNHPACVAPMAEA